MGGFPIRAIRQCVLQGNLVPDRGTQHGAFAVEREARISQRQRCDEFGRSNCDVRIAELECVEAGSGR